MAITGDKEDRQLKRLEKKDVRQQERIASKQMKDYDLGQQIKKESGIDTSKYAAPLTQEAKEKLTEGLTQRVSDDLKQKVKGFKESYATPEYKQPSLDEEALKRKLKREKRERYFDVLRGIGASMQGKDVQSSLMAPKLSEERQQQYQQYKDVVTSNKKRAEEWEAGYRDDLLNFIQDKLKDKDTSAMDKLKLEKLQAEIENIQTRTKWQKDKPYYSSSTQGYQYGDDIYLKGSNPYTSVLYSISEDPESLFNLPSKFSSTQKEDAAKQIILQMYDINTDAKGNQYLTPKEGKKDYLYEVKSDIERQKIQREIEDLKYTLGKTTGWGSAKKRQELEDQIYDLEQQLKSSTPVTQNTESSEVDPWDL